MKYFIKVKDTKVVECLSGAFDNDVEEFTKKGYIEIGEENLKYFGSFEPLKYINGVIQIDTEEKARIDKDNALGLEISALQNNLANTDYVVIKIAEGVATAEEYADKHKNRAEWRKRINEIEEALNNG